MDDLYPYDQPVAETKDRTASETDTKRFAGKHIKTLEGVTILSVGGRDGRLDDDYVLDTRLANGQRMQMVIDQHRYADSRAAIDRLHGHTNVFREDRNTPVEARFEGTYTQVPHSNTRQPEWVFRVAEGAFRDRDGVEHALGRPIHPQARDAGPRDPKALAQAIASSAGPASPSPQAYPARAPAESSTRPPTAPRPADRGMDRG